MSTATEIKPLAPPVLASGHTLQSVGDEIARVPFAPSIGRKTLIAIGIGLLGTMLLTTAIAWLLIRGVGIWGVNIPVAWGFAIVNFVWWIGIGHAGTFISAFLLLLRQKWRTSINRFAEAMTLFAVACAGMFPLLHLGRPWLFYWLLPYPNSMGLVPQFRSPLVWDVFAVSTYATVSLVFWYIGLIPDLAVMRDRATSTFPRIAYGLLAMGWRNSARHWQRYHSAYLLLAGLAAPLVISVHSVVGMDFAAAQLPGWHSTIFPPYFVAGAIFSGFAMVLTLGIPMRAWLGWKDFITVRHLDNCAKLMLVTGLIVAYGYAMEAFMGWLSGNEFEWHVVKDRAVGHYAVFYWMLIFCNVLTPQLLWFRAVRRCAGALFVIALIVQVGMWLERFVIVITSLYRSHLPGEWGMYVPTRWDWATLIGTIGFFTLCFALFMRLLPAIAISEMRELVHKTGGAK